LSYPSGSPKNIQARTGLLEAAWWEHYYVPLLQWIHELKKTYGGYPEFGPILSSSENEVEMYRKYRRYYEYTFFVMQKGWGIAKVIWEGDNHRETFTTSLTDRYSEMSAHPSGM
jgi:hypothetical protein